MPDQNDTTYAHTRRSAWTRLADILLRSLHVLVISVLFGGAVFKVPDAQLVHWRYMAAATGIALIISELVHGRRWPHEARGVMVYLHAGLFSLAMIRPQWLIACLLAAILIGMAGSHMPKKLRYWSFLRGGLKD